MDGIAGITLRVRLAPSAPVMPACAGRGHCAPNAYVNW